MATFDLDSADGTQAISAVSLPLPTGAATEAKQDTQITSLASIDAGIPAALGQTTMSASMPVVIASNQTTLPVTVSTEVEQATFVIQARDVAIGNGKSMLSLLNASGSSVTLKLRDLKIVNVQNTSVTGVVSEFGLYRITGHSAGTSLTPQAYDSNDSLNGSATARTGGTITGEATTVLQHWDWSSDEWSVGAQDVESYQHGVQVLANLLNQQKSCKPITLRAGQGITIKHVTNSTAGAFDIILVFTQE